MCVCVCVSLSLSPSLSLSLLLSVSVFFCLSLALSASYLSLYVCVRACMWSAGQGICLALPDVCAGLDVVKRFLQARFELRNHIGTCSPSLRPQIRLHNSRNIVRVFTCKNTPGNRNCTIQQPHKTEATLVQTARYSGPKMACRAAASSGQRRVARR